MDDDGDSSDEEMQPFVPDDVGLLTLKVNVSNNVSSSYMCSCCCMLLHCCYDALNFCLLHQNTAHCVALLELG